MASDRTILYVEINTNRLLLEMVLLPYIYFGHVQHFMNHIQQVIFELLKRKFQVSAKLSILGSTTELQDSDLSSFEKRWIILALMKNGLQQWLN